MTPIHDYQVFAGEGMFTIAQLASLPGGVD